MPRNSLSAGAIRMRRYRQNQRIRAAKVPVPVENRVLFERGPRPHGGGGEEVPHHGDLWSARRDPVPPERTGAAFREWVEARLRLPNGEALRILDWQAAIVQTARDADARAVAISTAPGNGLTTFGLAVLLAKTIGPLAGDPPTVSLAAAPSSLAAVRLREALIGILDASRTPLVEESARPHPGRITIGHDAQIDFASTERLDGQIGDAGFVWLDAPGTITKRRQGELASLVALTLRPVELWTGGHRGPRGGPFDVLLQSHRPRLHVADFQACPEEVTDPAAAQAANPSLGTLIDEEAFRTLAEWAAGAGPTARSEFRALHLNQRRPDWTPVVPIADWRACVTDTLPDREGTCFLAFDLGAHRSLSAAVALWPATEGPIRLESWMAVCAVPDLDERSVADHVPGLYAEMHARGELALHGEETCDVEAFAQAVIEDIGIGNIRVIARDSYRKDELDRAVRAVCGNQPSLQLFELGRHRDPTDAGAFSGAQGLRETLARRDLAHRPSLAAEQAIAGAKVVPLSGGREGMAKLDPWSRIDWAYAAAAAFEVWIGTGDD